MTASLDDLLRHEEPVRVTRRAEPVLRTVIRIAVQAGLLTTATYGVLRLGGLAVPPVLIFAGYVALNLVWRSVRNLAEPDGMLVRDLVRGLAGTRDNRPTWYAGQDGLVHALRRWETRLSWAATSSDRFVHTLPRHLGELVDERLRQRHGLTRASDPARARAICGEQLWTFLHEPTKYQATPKLLAAMINEMERL